MSSTLINPNPVIYQVAEVTRRENLDDEKDDPIDNLEVFGASKYLVNGVLVIGLVLGGRRRAVGWNSHSPLSCVLALTLALMTCSDSHIDRNAAEN